MSKFGGWREWEWPLYVQREAVLPLHLSILASTNIPSFPCGLLSRVYLDGHLSVFLGTILSCVFGAHRQGLVPGNSARLALCLPPPPSPGSQVQVSPFSDPPNPPVVSIILLPRTGMGTVSEEAEPLLSNTDILGLTLSLHPSCASVCRTFI